MKIVIVGTRGIPHILGGVEAVAEEIAPRLVAFGLDVTVIRRKPYVSIIANEETEIRNGERYWRGVRLVDVDSPKIKSFEALVHTWRAIRVAKELNADVVHINAVGPALMTPIAKMMGLKVVFHHHGPDYNRAKWGILAKIALKTGEWLGCSFADHTIVINEVIQKSVAARHNITNNVSLVYNGVAEPVFAHDTVFFSDLGIEEGKYILSMCRFVPEKHLHDLIDAFVLLRKGGRIPDDVRLVLAGDADYEDDYCRNLKQKARDAGVVLTGFVQGRKKFSLLTNALCYSLPSSHEGLSIALLEAMSYRLPVIASAIPANLEIDLPKECYHKVGDIDVLANMLSSLCSMSLHRVNYDMNKYGWDNIVEQVVEIYNSVIR